MTYYYRYTTSSTANQNQPTEADREKWEHIATKSNWRIVQLPNGYYQTEYKPFNCSEEECCDKNCDWIDTTRRETIQSAEASIDSTIEHYKKRLMFFNGPKVVRTFE